MSKKESFIGKIKTNCGLSKFDSYDEGRATKNFQIHIKNRDSFTVRKGNIIDWSNKNVLVIYFTRNRNPKLSAKEGDGFWNAMFKTLADIAVESHISKEEKENAKRKKIQWKYIEGIGS